MKLLSLNPTVAVVENFLEPARAKEIIAKYEDQLAPARIMTSKGIDVQDDRCTSYNCKLNPWADPLLTELVTSISSIVRLPPENAEIGTFMRYEGNQEFKPHSDAYRRDASGLAEMVNGGQRVFSTMVYLSDVKDGGETEFPKLKIRIKPKTGRLLIFQNAQMCSIDFHPHGLHAGLPLNDGVKFALFFGWRQLAYHRHREFPANSGETNVI